MSAVLLAALLQAAPEEGYKVEVRVTTTSDWTVVRFANAERFWVADQRLENPKGAKVATGPLSLQKPSFDATEVALAAEVWLRPPEAGDLEIVVTRGSIGFTKISIKGVADLTHDTTTGKGTNRRAFRVAADKVKALGASKLEGRKAREKLVLAFYYPWYGSKEGPSKRWVHWEPANHNASTNTPELGLYDSNDEAVIRKHIGWARSAGVDGFIASWWGQGTFEDRAVRKLLEVAEKEKFLVSAYVEAARNAAQLSDDMAYLVREFGRSPVWLKADGKAVLFAYTRVVNAFEPKDFAAARGDAVVLMDTLELRYAKAGGGLHVYNPVFNDLDQLRGQYQDAAFHAAREGLVFAATVVPGYDDTVIRKPGGKKERDGGGYYDASWRCALASMPDWVLVCSWNEWHEGSEIEPSREHGDTYLKKTAEWVRRLKGR